MVLFHRTVKKLLMDGADPNFLIPDKDIAAIHYAAGMENENFAESVMQLILKCNGMIKIERITETTICLIISNNENSLFRKSKYKNS